MRFKCAIRQSLALLLLYSCTVCIAAAEQSQSDAIEIVLDILRGDDQQMQTVAISMTREMPGPEVTKALANELPNLSSTCQVQLVSALGDRGDNAALPALIHAAKAKDKSVRVAAFRALGQLGNASHVSLLAQAAAHTTGEEQKAARDSLYRLSDPNVDREILTNIPKADAPVKVELIRSVGERNIASGMSPLITTAKDTDRKVRTESFRILKAIAGPEHLPVLVRLLIDTQGSSDRNEAEKTVAAVARKIEAENRRAEAVLAVLPSTKETEKRCSLLSVLGQIGDSSALPVLRAELGSRDVDVQTEAIRALSSWPTAEPLQDLLKLARDRDNPLQKTLALRGLVRVLGLADNLSAKEKVELYEQAMSLAPNTMEKKNVLSQLAKNGSLEAFSLVSGYLDDPALRMEAEIAAIKIAQVIPGEYPEQTTAVLKKIIQTTKNDSLRQQAQELIKQTEHVNDKSEGVKK
jgi:HEAT repeat protein